MPLTIPQMPKRLAFKVLRRIGAYETVRDFYREADNALRPPAWPGLRLTPKRLLNLYLVRYQRARGHTKLLGYPPSLTLEATNVCNLKCPFCFTGVGEVTRPRSAMPMPLYRKLIDELGDYALLIEFYNWGEPLLNRNISEMVRLASDKGIATIISTNFSVPFDRARAEALISSGLAVLGAGIDGASQESYEKYRAGGNFEKALGNLRLLAEVKREMGSQTPTICWSYHAFDHNRHEIDKARAMAEEMGVQFTISKGWVEGEEWDGKDVAEFPIGVVPERCRYLWTQTVINNDGLVSPCANTFYKEEDFGSVESNSFRDVWNNRHFQEARRAFRKRNGSTFGESLICNDCPYTIVWENHERHLAQGLPISSFDPVYTTNDWFNYFFTRRHAKRRECEATDAIDLRPVDSPSGEPT